MSGNFVNLISTCISFISTDLKWIWNALHHRSILEVPIKGPLELESSRLHHDPMSNEPVECAVCLSAIQDDDEITELRCKHLFHKDCLDRCAEHRHTKCPLCRDNLARPRMVCELGRELLVFCFCSGNISANDDFDRCDNDPNGRVHVLKSDTLKVVNVLLTSQNLIQIDDVDNDDDKEKGEQEEAMNKSYGIRKCIK
ncbi:hypothetical protein L2E82_08241 [Cichorium intybus]|uniref:Uncharacterized protein n=1 Tax=Cichorium intybus TaxID=13427 RepID=A0ACB9G5E0_CICIN|nr:hypothetical protein L2E82_08241 [Cichorium intybus]